MVLIELFLVLEILIEINKFYIRPGTNIKGGRMNGNHR